MEPGSVQTVFFDLVPLLPLHLLLAGMQHPIPVPEHADWQSVQLQLLQSCTLRKPPAGNGIFNTFKRYWSP